MEYREKECKSALNKINSNRLPYHWDLNIYRGCEHACQYCFAMYTHTYLNDNNYFDTIYYKKNIVEMLEKKLSSPKWTREVINIGGITDSYQPIEEKLQLTRNVLQVMLKYKNPVIISTKSDLILRDIDLIKELSKVTVVNIACTVTTLDENIRSILEPGACSSQARLKALKKIKEETNAIVGIHMMPIIPYLSSSMDNLEKIYYYAKKINVDYVLPGGLGLRGITRQKFLTFLKSYDKHKYEQLLSIYNNKNKKDEYTRQFYQKIQKLEEKYSISHNYQSIINKKNLEIEKNKDIEKT